MRRKILLMALCSVFCVQVNAAVTVSESTDPEYLINSGYSEAAAEEVLIVKNRVNGQPAEPLYDRSHSKFIRFWRNVYGYIDPAQDTDERIHHDIHMSPSAKDL